MSTTANGLGRGWPAAQSKLTYVWIACLVIPLMAVAAFALFQPIQVLPRIALAPGFSLIDLQGQRLTNEDLRGRFVLYNFIYTNCDDPCIEMGQSLAEIQRLVRGFDTGGIPVEFVTVSFDPERDTPAQMEAYAERVGADPANWHFVTGDPARLKNVVGGGFRVFYEPQADGSFRFDPTFVLVDGWGIIRAKYRMAALDPETVARDLRLVAREIENSTGASRLAYEAAHLFLCYPD